MTATAIPKATAHKQIEIGRILSVGASKAMVSINKMVIRNNQLHHAQIGTILKIITRDSLVVAMVSSLKIGGADEEGLGDGCLAQLDILGEIMTNPTTRQTRFYRGVRTFPVLNEPVYNMSHAELAIIFSSEDKPCIEIGQLHQDKTITAKVRTNDLLSKHFAIIGSTGSGKSCTVALVLRQTLQENPNAHVVLFDPHNEYSKSFGDKAEVIRSDTLDLPLWLFNFEETVELLTSDIEDQAKEETEVLYGIILQAKQLFERSRTHNDVTSQLKLDDVEKELPRIAPHISLDSPVPYRIRDVLKLLEHQMGKLENSNNIMPFQRLKRRIEKIMNDPRYGFVFRNQASPLPMAQLLGRIFRIPVNNKPIAIMDFSGIPSETLNVVVSVVSRLAFELAVWSERKVPILLVCEEAHRYIPADKNLGFNSTRQAISRIAKEGRKYGVSLAIVSQRPSELEPSTLSQCSTIFSMRLSNELDQNFVRAAVPDGADELLSFLPSLGTAEAMVFGESVNMPMRVILSRLSADALPHSSSAQFTDLWTRDNTSPQFMATVLDNWRTRRVLDRDEDVDEENLPLSVRIDRARRSKAAAVPQPSRPATTQELVQQMRQAQASEAPKKQSISDVKRMLNSAFNRE